MYGKIRFVNSISGFMRYGFRHVSAWTGAGILGMLLLMAGGSAGPMQGQEFTGEAHRLERQLTEKVMPYWYDTAQDSKYGAYLLADGLEGDRRAGTKQLVTQSRMIWGFAHVHRMGYRDPERNYLQAARQGYRFLRDQFHDDEHGGYFWSTDLRGEPENKRKILYGQAFVIYALVEYHRASGDQEPLEAAMALYRLLQQHAHDSEHQGWFEHFEADWEPILEPEPGAPVEVPGYKSANAHLH
jgi:mannobiose 2-epimerase